MQKPKNYEEVSTGGDFTPIEVGGHHAVIKSVKEQMSSTGKRMLVAGIDFAKNDSQPGYFKAQFDADTRDDKKWPYQAVQYIVCEDTEGKCSRNLKTFITSFEKSNTCETIWTDDDKFSAQFKNKKIGVVYGEVEEEYNGEVKTRRRIRWFCDDNKVNEQKVPERKELANKPVVRTDSNDFVSVPEGSDEEIPF